MTSGKDEQNMKVAFAYKVFSYRISEGKAPLGFLNPMLYSSGVAGLNDITSGSNPGCGTAGFTATAGWDPVRVLIGDFIERHVHPFFRSLASGLRTSVSCKPSLRICSAAGNFGLMRLPLMSSLYLAVYELRSNDIVT